MADRATVTDTQARADLIAQLDRSGIPQVFNHTRQLDEVVSEFSGNPQAMASAILQLRASLALATTQPLSGYAGFRSRADALVEALGGHHFVRAAVSSNSADILRRIVDERLGHSAARGLLFAEYMLATDREFDAAAEGVERLGYHGQGEAPDDTSHPVHGGMLALRGTRLWFETDRAHLLLAHAYEDTFRAAGRKERWCISLTDEAKAYFHHAGGKEPTQSSTGAGSREGAIKRLRALADTAFGAPLKGGVAEAHGGSQG